MRARAVLFLAEPREHARDRLRQRQQFLNRQELGKHFRLVRHRAESAAHE